jgi:hypothetical protein
MSHPAQQVSNFCLRDGQNKQKRHETRPKLQLPCFRQSATEQKGQDMPSDEADIRELNPRREDTVARIQDRWGGASPLRAELVREGEKLNRQTVKRVAEQEARSSLPVLEKAAVVAEHGQRLRSMAAFAEDPELENEIGAVLRRLATAADPHRPPIRRQV